MYCDNIEKVLKSHLTVLFSKVDWKAVFPNSTVIKSRRYRINVVEVDEFIMLILI